MPDSLLIGWWIAFIILSLFFSGIEEAFTSSDKLRYAVGNQSAGFYNYLLNAVYRHPRKFLTSLMTGKVIALVFFCIFHNSYLSP